MITSGRYQLIPMPLLIRPRVNIAIGLFSLGMGLLFFESFRYQYVVSPDYFDLFWMIPVPIFFVSWAIGLLAICRGLRASSMAAPFLLLILVVLHSGGLAGAARPSSWPTPVPIFVYVFIIVGLIALIVSPHRHYRHDPDQVPKDLKDQRRILRENVAKVKANESS